MKKSFIITSMAGFAALCFSLTAQAQGPVVVSGKDDYSPGETALFQAAGFQPGELLDFSVAAQGDDGTWLPDIAWADVPAGGSGNAEVDYVVPDTWANKTLQLTVMGLSSSLMATTTFTDSAAVHNVRFAASGLPDGTTFTITGEFTNTQGVVSALHAMITTPSSTAQIGCKVNTVDGILFIGYDNPIPGVGGHYTLTSITLGGASTDGALHNLNISGIEGGGKYDTGASNTGGGTDSVITGNYTFVPDATPNSTPVITPQANVSKDLGQTVGCLNGIGGFSTSVDVTFSVSQVDTKNFNVFATFSSAGNPQVLIATVYDNDGNLSSSGVTLNPSGQTLTFTGPGSNMQSFSTSVTAADSLGASAGPTTCPTVGNATVQVVYNFNGFFSPLSNTATTKVKRGSTVPVKFQVTDCSGNVISTSSDTISVAFQSGSAPSGTPDVDDAGASNDNGIYFRWDPTGMQDIFNLKTDSTYSVGDTYKVTAHLDDGTTHDASISIK